MAKLTNTVINGSERIKGILYADDIQGTVTKVKAIDGVSKIYLLGAAGTGSAVPYLYSGLYYENGVLHSPTLCGSLDGSHIDDGTIASAKLETNLTVRGSLGVVGAMSANSIIISNGATINGDLVVKGTTTTVNTDNLSIKDQLLELGKRDDESPITGFTGFFVRNYDSDKNSGFIGFDNKGWGYIGDVTVEGNSITGSSNLQCLATVNISDAGIYKYDITSHNFVKATDDSDFVSKSVLLNHLSSYDTTAVVDGKLEYYVKKTDDITDQIETSLGYTPVSPSLLTVTLSDYLTIANASSTYYTKTVLDSKEAAIYSKISDTSAGLYSFKGSVAAYADLPTEPNTGDEYAVQTADSSKGIAAGDMFVYSGSSWTNKGATYRYTVASSTIFGGFKTGYATSNANRKYGILLDSNSKAYVNVPWLDHPTYSRADIVQGADSPDYGEPFTVVSSITSDNGHVTSVGTKSVYIPAQVHWTHKLKVGSQTLTWDDDSQTKTLDTTVFMSDLGIGKGDLEFKGVVATLPSTAEIGWMYKASAAFTIAKAKSAESVAISVKAGDTIIAADDTPTWYCIPSGDDVEDTWRSIKVKGAQSLDSSITGNAIDLIEAATAPITLTDEGNGVVSFGLKSITEAGAYATASNTAVDYEGSFNIPNITVDAYGRVALAKDVAITLPAKYVHPSANRTDPNNLASTLDHEGKLLAVTSVSNDAYGHISAVQKTSFTLPKQYVHPTYPTYTLSSDSPSSATKTLTHSLTFDAITSITSDNGHINGFTTTTFTMPDQYVHPDLTRTDTTSTESPALDYGKSFKAISSVTTDSMGHVSAVNVKTMTLPAQYVLSVSTTGALGGIKLYANAGTSAVTPSNANRTYQLLLDSNNKAYVNVPWTDTLHPTYSRADTSSSITPAHSGSFTAVDSVTSDNGHVIAVNLKTITLPGIYVHPTLARADTTSSVSPAHEETFTSVDSVTTDATGHVSAVNVKTVTLPKDTHWSHTLKLGTQTVSWDSDNLTKEISVSTLFQDLGVGKDVNFMGATSTLPTSSSEGDMYKASASFSLPAASNAESAVAVTVKAGDTIIASGVSGKWYYIPSGDDVEDTWRSIKVKGTALLGSGIDTGVLNFVDGDMTAASGSGHDVKISHNAIANDDLTTQARRYVNGITFDDYGHITAYTTGSETVVDTNTWRNIQLQGTDVIGTGIGTGSLNFDYSGATTVAYDKTNKKLVISSTDQSVSDVGHHYVPVGTTTISASGATATAGATKQVVTGLTTDSSGHVTAVTSGAVIDTVYAHPTYARADGTSASSPEYGKTFTAIDSVSTTNGHVTGVNLKTVTLPTYTLPVSTTGALGGLKLYANAGSSAVTPSNAGRTYGLLLDSNNKAYVNVPWTDTVYTHPTYSRTDTESAASPSHGETFTAVDGVTTANGHVTGVNLKTVTLPGIYVHPTYSTTASTPIAKTLDHAGSFTALTGVTASNGHVTGYVNQTYNLPAQYVHPTLTRADTATAPSAIAYGGNFTAVDSVTTDTKGHISAINVKTVTLPDEIHWVHKVRIGTQTLMWNADDGSDDTELRTFDTATMLDDLGIGRNVGIFFKGVLKDSLPTTALEGYMYKIGGDLVLPKESNAEYTDGSSVVDITMKLGDTIIAANATPTWYYIPSGDDIEDTWRPLFIDGNNQGTNSLKIVSANQNRILLNGDSGTATFDLASLSSSGTYGETAARQLTSGSSFNVPYIVVDAYGRITTATNRVMTLPASDNTWRNIYVNGVEKQTISDSHPLKFISGGSSSLSFNDTTYELTVSSTDRSVTAAGYHYSPVNDPSSDLTASGASVTTAVGSATQVITGINLDSKGHVTGIVSGAVMDTDTKYVHPSITASAVTDDSDTLVYGGTSPKTSFSVVSSVVTNGQGHVTSVHSKSVILPDQYVHPTYSTSASTPTAVELAHAGTFSALTGITASNGHVTGYVNQSYKLPAQYVHPTYTTSATTSAASPAHTETFTAVDSISTTNGHVTKVNTKTVTLPADTHWSHHISVAGVTGTWDADNETVSISADALYSALGIGKGDLEFIGVVTALPTSSDVGYMYKVGSSISIPAAQSAEEVAATAKAGDTIICKTASETAPVFWLVPSGNEVESWRKIQINGTDASSLSSSISSSPLNLFAGSGVNITDAGSGKVIIAHSDTSSKGSLAAGTRTYINSLTIDGFGHVTDYGTASESVVDTNTWRGVKVGGTAVLATAISSGDINFAGSGASSASWDSTTNTITISSADSKVTSVANHYTGGAYDSTIAASGASVQAVGTTQQVLTGVKIDKAGHITGVTSAAIKDTDTVYVHPTYARSDTTSTLSPAYAGSFTAIDGITATNGHITSVNVKTVTLPAQYVHPTYATTETIPATDGTDTSTLAYGGTFDALTALTASNGHTTNYVSSRFKLPAQYVHPTFGTTIENIGSTTLGFGDSVAFVRSLTADNGHVTKVTSATVAMPYVKFYSETDADDGMTMSVMEY